jgi:hypothetical protein
MWPLKGWDPIRFVTINSDLSHAYLGSNIASVPEHLINIASPIRENSGESHFIIHFTKYIDKAVLYSISEEVLTVLMDRLKLPYVFIL